mmetsp:Transcript_8545/g.20993  ORF Transcript_8545/g.20993 Transcript_8545/m.20993 type:complete len:303 (+) Transcript_8545:183-1091(+)|eukprot:CAMPEP_0114506024 /NCGR_PEP_ID=MMETSP0109-20121206/11189_1 /TAXON_ID=29199 /ORGANISM="Chlorarachnion reptans, Strain CCCM449" /LENGTH=302 /DNA_ID=CAMNT_0001684549 /DNA_START=554 /DNA_END=1462 /DNA_ORIENTATION=+
MTSVAKQLAFTVPSSVTRTTSSFEVKNSKVVADIYRPKESKTGLPAIVFSGALSAVKEQSTGAYGSALASRGFVCISLDHRGFGESEGEPRQYENYEIKIEDLHAAVDWVVSGAVEGVDTKRIGVCGVCLGAAYAVGMAVETPSVLSAGFVVPLFMRKGTPSAQSIAARKLYEETGEVQMIKAASVTEDAAMPMQIAVDYYSDPERALVANYRNEIALMSREKWNEFDSPGLATKFSLPMLMIHGKQSFAKDSGVAFFKKSSSTDKKLEWIDSLPHTDFYDNPKAIKDIVGQLADHFGRTLA